MPEFDVENQHISICVGMRVEPCFFDLKFLGDSQPKDGDADQSPPWATWFESQSFMAWDSHSVHRGVDQAIFFEHCHKLYELYDPADLGNPKSKQ